MNYSKGNWSLGKTGGSVVTDDPTGFSQTTGHGAHDYYGGYLIAESILKNPDALLIAAAPKMLEALVSVRTAMLKNGISVDNADQYNTVDRAIKVALKGHL